MSYIGNTAQNQSYAPGIDYFSGNGSTVAFTLSRPVNVAAEMLVFVANVPQNPSTAFTVSGNTITFTSAPPAGTNNIWVEYTSLITNLITPGQNTVGVSQLAATGTPSSATYLRGDNTWAAVSGGALWQSAQTTNFTAVKAYGYPINTTAGAITVTLPAAPAIGDFIHLVDYAGTWGTNNVTVSPNGGKIQGSTSSAVLSTNREAIALVYIDSTQGWVNFGGFVNNPIGPYTGTYLVVAGGGGASYGGGGAGGLLTGTTSLTPGASYAVTVGAGGAGTTNGTNSTGFGLTAIGGGYGAASVASNGGSGGGSGQKAGYGTVGTGTTGQGYSGGLGYDGVSQFTSGGGGGGAGGAGSAAPSAAGGSGGPGLLFAPTGAYYAGGGSGGTNNSGNGTGPWAGGIGGGGEGRYNVTGANGSTNTGGGGGGGPGASNGGSGVVIVAYLGGQRGTGGTITTSGSYTVHTFTASGTFTA
jgi:hypothetical protein